MSNKRIRNKLLNLEFQDMLVWRKQINEPIPEHEIKQEKEFFAYLSKIYDVMVKTHELQNGVYAISQAAQKEK